jgi:hypothetical protein
VSVSIATYRCYLTSPISTTPTHTHTHTQWTAHWTNLFAPFSQLSMNLRDGCRKRRAGYGYNPRWQTDSNRWRLVVAACSTEPRYVLDWIRRPDVKNKVKCSVHCHATEFDCGNFCGLEDRTELYQDTSAKPRN